MKVLQMQAKKASVNANILPKDDQKNQYLD